MRTGRRLKKPWLTPAPCDSGLVITVGATVLALFPLAIHCGSLWQPLCY